VAADINKAALEVETFVRGYSAAGVTPTEVQVRPSGDDVDVIKVWIDLGTATADPKTWATECEAAIKQAVPSAASFQISVRCEAVS